MGHAGDHVGEYGVTLAKAGDSEAGVWYCFVPISELVFASLTRRGQDFVSGDITDYTFKSGEPRFGHFTAFEVTSGEVEFYKSNPLA